MNLTFDIFKTRFKFSIGIYRVRDTWTRGYMNRTKDGYYTFILDYDMTRLEWIEFELQRLQEIYDLGDINIFQSSEKGFHARSSVKLTAKGFVELMNNSSCDSAFKNLPRFATWRNWVLRDEEKGKTPKPKFIKTLLSQEPTRRQQSSAIYKYHQLLYPDIKERLVNPDNIMEMTAIEYATGGNVL